ncbi:MAG: hypothetical protein NZ765_12460 [Anaerolineae bacterium]|nr:hypothetical protein [Anaerolineae bacterium]MDW8071837.1 hypothetical protein [Anaerolineae bacterium]
MAMLLLRRWLEAHLQGLAYLLTGHRAVAQWLFFVLFLPGVLVHELSHWLVARLLGVRTGRLEIWPRTHKGEFWLGSVQVGRADPLRSSLIGLAPLVTGSLAVAAIGNHLRLNVLGDLIAQGDWPAFWYALGTSARLPDFWLWIYLLFAIANRMLPSPADRKPWRPVLIFIVLITLGLLLTGWAPELSDAVRQWLRDTVQFLIYALTLIVVIDLIAALLVAILETLVGVLKQQRVVY